MKKIIIFCTLLFCIPALADTININWMVGNSVYDTSTCTVGGNVPPPSTNPTKYGYTFEGWVTYIPLEYIESTGTQYIDTGVKDTFKVEMSINVTATNTDYTLLYGSQKASSPVIRRNVNMFVDTHKIQINVGTNNNASIVASSAGMSLGAFHNLTMVFGTTASIALDGVTTTATSTGDNASTGLNDYLFCYNYSGSPNYKIKAKVAYARVYGANGSLVRDFVPARRESDNAIGMFDTVSNQFFGNSGTGDFVAGPVVGGN